MPCKCGSTTHKRTNHKDCPLSMSRQSSDSSSESSSDSEAEVLGKRSLSSVYPDLYGELSARRPDEKKLRHAIKERVQVLAVPEMYPFLWDMCETFCKMAHEYRSQNNLSSINLPVKDIADEIYATMMEDMDFAEDIANEMPLQRFDTSKSFEELMQECYDTTKTKHFKRAVEKVVEFPGAFMHALALFKKNKEDENVQAFLMKYSKQLYNRHMQNIEINIAF